VAILTPEERLGTHIAARYRLDAVLATGGMGVLFESRDEATGEPVVVKILKPAYALEPDRVARFAREMRIAASLRHPNIVRVRYVAEDECATPFFVMDRLEGRSLAQELEERHVLGIADALAIAVPVAHALAMAHARGVLHRDVKPSNIFLARDAAGQIVPKLLDFGIATSATDDFATQTGVLLGTPGYMAPEQAQHAGCGPSTDIWALAAVLYRCVMGHPPHAAESVPEILRRLVREPVPPIVVAGANKVLCATIDRALAREPHHRYPSMERFARALAEAAMQGESEPSTDARPAFAVPAGDPAPAVPGNVASARPPRLGRPIGHGWVGLWAARLPAFAWLGAALVVGASLQLAPRAGVARGTQASDVGRVNRAESAEARVVPTSEGKAATPQSPALGAAASRSEPAQGAAPDPASTRRVRGAPRPPTRPSTASLQVRAERDPATGLPVVTQW
jgi:hypothetical protein